MYLTILNKLRPAYNFNRKDQVILLMITDNKKWHHLSAKKLSALHRGIHQITL